MVQFGNVTSPYLYETLQGLIGQMIAVQQTGNHVQQGILTGVLPDHLVLDVCRIPFFIRMDQVVWVTPARQK